MNGFLLLIHYYFNLLIPLELLDECSIMQKNDCNVLSLPHAANVTEESVCFVKTHFPFKCTQIVKYTPIKCMKFRWLVVGILSSLQLKPS